MRAYRSTPARLLCRSRSASLQTRNFRTFAIFMAGLAFTAFNVAARVHHRLIRCLSIPSPAFACLPSGGMSEPLKEIDGFTWPGIEFGHPPSCKYSFYEYVDALRLGNLERFREIEAEGKDWWFPTLDRGAGAALHFAVDHGQLAAVRFLVEERGAEVNQQDARQGWTPLHRAARVAHYTHAPHLEVFEYLLQHGADAALMTFEGFADPATGKPGPLLSVLEVAVEQGRGWETGRVRQLLQGLIEKHAAVPKAQPYVYKGPLIGPTAAAVLKAWQDSSAALASYPPENWRPPPPAGFLEAAGMRRTAEEPWRPAREDDGSCFLRQMTDAELTAQSQAVAAR